MRQRSIENQIRSLANAITGQFCESMEKKSEEWKKRITDIERRRGKCFKKGKSKKYYSPADLVAEQREGCLELLFEQRNQFAFFVNALLPILVYSLFLIDFNWIFQDIEVNLLGEGEQVMQVRDHLDQMVNETDPQTVVYSSMDDFCLNSERRLISPAQSIISSATSGGLDRTMSPSIDSFYSISRNSTISYGNNQRPALPGSFIHSSPIHSRPPIPRQPGYEGENRSRGSSQVDALSTINGFSASEGNGIVGRRARPLSFSGDHNLYSNSTLKAMNTPGDRSSASLIAETLQQIDQLGVELDSYCMTLNQADGSSGVGSSVVSSMELQNTSSPGSNSTPMPTPPTFRQGYGPNASMTMKNKPRPPPPERRNSAIQSATSAAPSIADLRTMNGDYSHLQFRSPPRYPQGQAIRPPPIPFPNNLFNQ